MKPVITVAGLGKTYRIFQGPRARLQEVLWGGGRHHVVEALKDIGFSVMPGEAFGIVGDNGAGKSTLLKILSGTAVATRGEVEVSGRLAALLELGAGFHPEFTGRENIYFSGAVMGLSREEVRRQEESIIEFSELGDFIDEPVKTYSSGMYVRLGFAVATGFDFSVLLVDEALSVGDQRFQKKCTDRILDFRRQGKTILFCSHNLYHVRTLCDRAIWLHRGETRSLGTARRVVDEYRAFTEVKTPPSAGADATSGPAPGRVCWVVSASVQDLSGRRVSELRSGESFRLELVGRFSEDFIGRPALGASIVHGDGTAIYTVVSSMEGFDLNPVGDELYRAYLVFDECPLLSGRYSVHAYATDQNHLKAYDIARDVASFTVVNDRLDQGLVRLRHRWESA